ncbi:MAG: HAMP domain-containing histidine kinase [Clostridiales bacterium]|nr:HAMP domain-containing histidine kinase [Clostridiales bacterium]
MKQLSIRTKITLWFSAILIVVVALTYLVILSISGQIIQKTIQDNLILAVENNVDEIEYFSSVDSVDIDEGMDYYIHYNNGYVQVDDDFLDKVNQIYTSLSTSDGSLVYGVNPIARETAEMSFLDSEVQTVTVDGTLYYVFDRKLEQEGLEDLWLRGIVSETQGETELSAISRTSLILLPSLLLLAIIGGFLIARRALKPIQQISETASQIRQGDDLKRRIDLGEGTDELHQLADQFNEMFTRLDQSFQAQQQFVSDASHELRTPVTVINAQCELALDSRQDSAGYMTADPDTQPFADYNEAQADTQGSAGHKTNSADKHTLLNYEKTAANAQLLSDYEEALHVIWRQGRKMNRLISSMLDFTRLELQPERYQKENLNLSELVESVCSDMALIREKDITLTWDVESNVLCTGNRELLTRLLSNLIGNAYRYGVSGGHTNVRLHTEENTLILAVADDGIGISAEKLPNIFHRFYQADDSHTGEGNGLGLAMVKEIAEFHGGTISVKSEPGQGSVFSFTFPGTASASNF